MSDRPVWLLDVDGVINAATEKPDTSVWPAEDWTATRLHYGARSLPVLVAEPVLAFIRETHTAGRAEIRWLTTWMEHTEHLTAAFDLPCFPLAATEDEFRGWQWRGDGMRWWKLPAVKRALTEGRPVVWTDDDITWSLGRRGVDDLRALGPLLAVSPNEQTGLTPKHLRQIGEFLDLHVPEESQ